MNTKKEKPTKAWKRAEYVFYVYIQFNKTKRK